MSCLKTMCLDLSFHVPSYFCNNVKKRLSQCKEITKIGLMLEKISLNLSTSLAYRKQCNDTVALDSKDPSTYGFRGITMAIFEQSSFYLSSTTRSI